MLSLLFMAHTHILKIFKTLVALIWNKRHKILLDILSDLWIEL